MAILKFTKTAMSNLFSQPATEMYPVVKKEYNQITKGHIVNDIDVCIFCGMCQRKCPTQALEVDKNTKYWAIDRLRCIQCSNCVDHCPKKCLSMDNQYTAPSQGSIKDEMYARVPDND